MRLLRSSPQPVRELVARNDVYLFFFLRECVQKEILIAVIARSEPEFWWLRATKQPHERFIPSIPSLLYPKPPSSCANLKQRI